MRQWRPPSTSSKSVGGGARSREVDANGVSVGSAAGLIRRNRGGRGSSVSHAINASANKMARTIYCASSVSSCLTFASTFFSVMSFAA